MLDAEQLLVASSGIGNLLIKGSVRIEGASP